MIDKVQKIRKEVEKLKSQLLRGACSSQIAMETRCKDEAYDEVLALLDSMQEEPVSEDLEDAAKKYAKKIFKEYLANPDIFEKIDIHRLNASIFKAGAKWQAKKGE